MDKKDFATEAAAFVAWVASLTAEDGTDTWECEAARETLINQINDAREIMELTR